MTAFTLNGRRVVSRMADDTPLLWALREEFGLTGAKYGCGIAQCGVCKVLVDDVALPACATPLSAIAGRRITTIEGLSPSGEHPLQKAWLEVQAPQCGYCQPGQIIQAVALLTETPRPTDAEIDAAMNGNLCRCGTYPRIKAAIKLAAGV
jgi:isoquinoline 1-oxidoreductase subunit alpha